MKKKDLFKEAKVRYFYDGSKTICILDVHLFVEKFCLNTPFGVHKSLHDEIIKKFQGKVSLVTTGKVFGFTAEYRTQVKAVAYLSSDDVYDKTRGEKTALAKARKKVFNIIKRILELEIDAVGQKQKKLLNIYDYIEGLENREYEYYMHK